MKDWSLCVWGMIIVLSVTGGMGAIPCTQTDEDDPVPAVDLKNVRPVLTTYPEFIFPGTSNSRGAFVIRETQPDLVPEPATVLLLGIGLLGFAILGREKKVR